MSASILCAEDFRRGQLDDRLVWLNPPPSWETGTRGLVVRPAPKTDFWCKTHYGFEADNGHFLNLRVQGDFRMSTLVRLSPVHRYDQAGLMVRISPDCWIKTSLEFELDRPGKLGAVVTNYGYSDWSSQDVASGTDLVRLRVEAVNRDYTIWASLSETGDDWQQLRIAHLFGEPPADGLQVGLYACSPQGDGFEAVFESIEISGGLA